ncbi:MAG: beta-glucanase (GH16 family) [Paraglaciecola sp.]|jgi:beta-glucanase (GH16 family)
MNVAFTKMNLYLSLITLSVLSGCSKDQSGEQDKPRVTSEISTKNQQLSKFNHAAVNSLFYHDSVIWAVNVGGDEYRGLDGVNYQADKLKMTAEKGHISKIYGSQDPTIFSTYRVGALHLEHPLDNGSYDITFKFAEPDDIAMDARVFDVIAQGIPVLTDLSVRLARDGKHQSALVRSVTDVAVTNGKLDIRFEASAGQAILSAIIVRKKVLDTQAWTLSWSDEFDYQGAPDKQKWNFDIWPARKVNDEDQTYTSRAKNVRVEDGKLLIEAHKEAYAGAEYTSGRIHTLGKADFLYGRADIRAKLPAGQGTWSAIWMLPSDPFKYSSTCQDNEDWQGSASCDAWPNSGEIDIMEHVGFDMHNIHGTVHNKAFYWRNWEQRKASINGENVDQAFHLYSIQWTPDSITVFFDGSPYFSYFNQSGGWQEWPFDHPYHLILNLAIGGAWGRAGGPIDDSIFPVRMEVDYVRIYQLQE